MKKLIKLLLFLLVANAVYQFVPPFWRYTRFKEDVQNVALQAKGKSDDEVAAEVHQLAATIKLPLAADSVQIRRSADRTHTYIDVAWAETVEFLPRQKYPWRFEVHADGWHVRPVTVDDLR